MTRASGKNLRQLRAADSREQCDGTANEKEQRNGRTGKKHERTDAPMSAWYNGPTSGDSPANVFPLARTSCPMLLAALEIRSRAACTHEARLACLACLHALAVAAARARRVPACVGGREACRDGVNWLGRVRKRRRERRLRGLLTPVMVLVSVVVVCRRDSDNRDIDVRALRKGVQHVAESVVRVLGEMCEVERAEAVGRVVAVYKVLQVRDLLQAVNGLRLLVHRRVYVVSAVGVCGNERVQGVMRGM